MPAEAAAEAAAAAAAGMAAAVGRSRAAPRRPFRAVLPPAAPPLLARSGALRPPGTVPVPWQLGLSRAGSPAPPRPGEVLSPPLAARRGAATSSSPGPVGSAEWSGRATRSPGRVGRVSRRLGGWREPAWPGRGRWHRQAVVPPQEPRLKGRPQLAHGGAPLDMPGSRWPLPLPGPATHFED